MGPKLKWAEKQHSLISWERGDVWCFVVWTGFMFCLCSLNLALGLVFV